MASREPSGATGRGSGRVRLFGSRAQWAALALAVGLGLALFTLVDLTPRGIDEMIHFGYAVRGKRREGGGGWPAWQQALSELWRPVLISMLVVASGFALFLLSSFPPTQRLGILVCAGAIITDLVVLVVLPAAATLRSTGRKSA